MITTYISHVPADPYDKVLKQLLSDVRLVTGKDWYVQEHKVGLFRGRLVYELVVRLQGIEFQIINFYSATSGTSLNTLVPIEWIVGFLHGILCGDAGVKHDIADFSKHPPAAPSWKLLNVTVGRELWDRIVDYLTQHMDVVDGNEGEQRPNEAMQLVTDIQRAGLHQGPG